MPHHGHIRTLKQQIYEKDSVIKPDKAWIHFLEYDGRIVHSQAEGSLQFYRNQEVKSGVEDRTSRILRDRLLLRSACFQKK